MSDDWESGERGGFADAESLGDLCKELTENDYLDVEVQDISGNILTMYRVESMYTGDGKLIYRIVLY